MLQNIQYRRIFFFYYDKGLLYSTVTHFLTAAACCTSFSVPLHLLCIDIPKTQTNAYSVDLKEVVAPEDLPAS